MRPVRIPGDMHASQVGEDRQASRRGEEHVVRSHVAVDDAPSGGVHEGERPCEHLGNLQYAIEVSAVLLSPSRLWARSTPHRATAIVRHDVPGLRRYAGPHAECDY